jgi:hypothetical protein
MEKIDIANILKGGNVSDKNAEFFDIHRALILTMQKQNEIIESLNRYNLK